MTGRPMRQLGKPAVRLGFPLNHPKISTNYMWSWRDELRIDPAVYLSRHIPVVSRIPLERIRQR
jgi:hypothetical protein